MMDKTTISIPLQRIAHGRTGDKGNRFNISVIAYHPSLFPLLVAQVTEERVAERFGYRQPSLVRRYVLPTLGALNFVFDDALDGGVNGSLNLDTHGKALAFLLLELAIELPASLTNQLVGPAASPGQLAL